MKRALLMFALLGSSSTVSPIAAQVITGVDAELTAIEDSTAYLIYRYRFAAAAGSSGGIATMTIDVSAPGAGTSQLPSTGPFMHAPSIASMPTTEHVPMGAVSPPGWQAFLTAAATIDWHGIAPGAVDLDSIPAGVGLAGFAIRSPYLPSVRESTATPTWQSCCSQPDPSSEEGAHPSASEFAIVGLAVAPARDPALVVGLAGLALAVADGDEACTLGWIDPATCTTIQASLTSAETSLAQGDSAAAGAALQVVIDELNVERGATVNENAFWLLSIGSRHLLAQFPTLPPVVGLPGTFDIECEREVDPGDHETKIEIEVEDLTDGDYDVFLTSGNNTFTSALQTTDQGELEFEFEGEQGESGNTIAFDFIDPAAQPHLTVVLRDVYQRTVTSAGLTCEIDN